MTRKFFCLLILMFVAYSNAFSQSKSVNQKGWEIPDLKNLKLSDEKIKIIDDISINEKIFKIEDIKPAIFIKEEENSKEKRTTFWEVRKAISYSSKDSVFAYCFSYVPFVISETQLKENEKIKSKNYIGLIYSLYYIDENGDGKFETRYAASKTNLTLPNWIKN